MKRIAFVTLLVILGTLATMTAAQITSAPTSKAKRAVFMAPLTWRADGSGLYTLADKAALNKAGIAQDGSVTTDSDEGTCELSAPYTADGAISTVSANWTFTGSVTMEITTTGKAGDYKPVTNGVPLDLIKSSAGSSIRWRATLEPNSSLSEVRITYKDSSGVAGSFGNPDLSGFAARKAIYVKGSSEKSLYNFQILIKVGESQTAGGSDVYLDSPSKSDLADIRFTQGDGETSLPYYLESVTGAKPDRLAAFWVRIPEIPKDAGLPIYIYYGASKAADLSSPEKVFDFFDSFNGSKVDPAKWQVYLENKTSAATIAGSLLELDMARVTSANCNFASGIIEYRAKVSASGAAGGIIVAGKTPDDDLMASSSIIANAAHCIMQGGSIISNDPKPIEPDTFYDYRIILDTSSITFQRYADGWSAMPQAETKCSLSNLTPSPIGLSSGKGGTGFYCDWIRIRKGTAIPPLVDVNKTASSVEEGVDLPVFTNLALGADGSVILAPSATTGEYTSHLIRAPFQARIITMSLRGADSSPSLRGGADSSSSLRGTEGAEAISISTNGGTDYTTGWQSGIAKYASKKDFVMGSKLRWKADFDSMSSSLKKLSLEFQPGTINVVIPGGGEVMKPADQYTILWNANGYDPSYNMNLSYSTDAGATFKPIASNVPNDGMYLWSVPQAESNQAMVKVADSADSSIYGISPNSFTISQNASALIGGEKGQEGVIGVGAATQTTQAGTTTQAETAPTTQPQAQTTQAVPETAPAGAKLYELAIKRIDPKNAKDANPSAYKDGDIITIMPAGTVWGAEDVKNFTIVRMYLTDSEVQGLTAPIETTNGADKPMVEQRRYKVDFMKDPVLKKEAVVSKGHLQSIVSRVAIADKSTAN